MRLFVALLPAKEQRRALAGIADGLRGHVKRASFTLEENLHLTLSFLGEASAPNAAIEAVGALSAPAFELAVTHIGSFKSGGEHTVWAGVEECAALKAVYAQLAAALKARGFKPDPRGLSPHITLARRAVPNEGFSFSGIKIEPIKISANKISLMRSDRIDGRLRYTELYAKPLG